MNNQKKPDGQAGTMGERYIELCGALHIHTRYSDGGVDCPSLIRVAQEVGLDYIVITDHMTLQGKEDGFEGLHDRLAVLVGYEHNDDQDKNHYLAIGTDHVIQEQHSVQEYISQIHSSGGIGFLAHPAERRHYFKRYPSYPWTAWDATGYDGIELWNHMSEWVENLRHWGSFITIFYPRRFIKRVPRRLLRRWDELNCTRFISGIGGVDAHTFQVNLRLFKLEIFPIKVELKGIRTHLYVPVEYKAAEFSVKKEMIMHALKNGHGFISNYRRGDASGTIMHLRWSDDTYNLPGKNDAAATLPAELTVSLPVPAEVHLLRNGIICERQTGLHSTFTIFKPGLYRIEVYKKRNAWIYSNPFHVGDYPLK